MLNKKTVDAMIGMSQADKLKIIERYERDGGQYESLPIVKKNNEYVIGTVKSPKVISYVRVKTFYDILQKKEPSLFLNPEEIIKDREHFLVHLAKWIFEIPDFVKGFVKLYQQDPLRYYRLAIENKYYNHTVLNDGNLLVDFDLKRIFGVLLAAEQDEVIREKIESIFFDYDSSLKGLIEARSAELLQRIEHKWYKGSAIACALFSYLLLNRYTYDGKSAPVVAMLVSMAYDTCEICENHGDMDAAREYINGDENPFKYIECSSEYSWKLIKELRSLDDIIDIERCVKQSLGVTHEGAKNRKIPDIINRCPMGDPCLEEISKALGIIEAFGVNMNANGLTTIRVFYGRKLSQAEQQKLLRQYAWDTAQLDRVGVWKENQKARLSVDGYVAILLMHFFTQNECEEKRVFFENNNETMFSHVAVLKERLEKEKHEKTTRISECEELRDRIHLLRKENELLKEELKQENKTAEAPYREELARLQKNNDLFEKKLEQAKEKDAELNLLREFAFDVRSQYTPCGTESDFADRVKGRRIVVVGGHIQWRNKLKKKYPEITVMDGHVETQDISLFARADFVFLNVSNMSHGMYYKVIEALRGSKVPFDYLGRTINQELYEREMVDILSKHGID